MLFNACRVLQRILIYSERPRAAPYKALCELGKALKTAFLRHSLLLESPSRVISRELTANDSWNSANAFILYGKGGEFARCELEHQQILVPPLRSNRRYKREPGAILRI